MATPNAVVAKLHNQASYEEGEAATALTPGTGCVLYEDEGEKFVRSAEADEDTTRVVREARNPPRGLGEPEESPLVQGYNAEEQVETLGFNTNDQARVLLADGTAGDEVGWNGDGHVTATEVGTAVGRIRQVVDVNGTDFAVVEFI